ncbi:MAG TPA: choice-of-anchor J domain-containing protein [Flavisolibacter sp.]
MKKIYTLLAAFVALTTYGQTYHPLASSSFTQNWANTGLITANDIWTGVPSIIGYLGQDITTSSSGANPQTLVTTSAIANDIDVIANQSNPNTQTSGGVAEFDGIPNPVVALQGSGTADAPHLIIYLNTTGTTSVRVQYKIRDVDGSADNAVQQVALQYRIGNTGNFINLPAGYVADATTANTATQETDIDVTLPSAADNQAQVQVRIITSNASGSDEWVGIDDINITSTTAGGDVTPPTVSSLFPSDNATGVAINATATINFSETVQKGTGNIYVRRISDNVAVQTIDVTSAAVTVSGTQVRFGLTLANSTDYYIEIDATAFSDIANNGFAGITGNSTWNFTTVAPPAAGVIGTTYTFNACGNYFNEGFQTYSVSGSQVWTCSKFGRTYTTDPSLDSAIEMNGFASGAQTNEDWLISPKFDLTGTTFPLLNFYSTNSFAGPSLSLRVSTNYAGTGDPSLATWTTINGEFPAENSRVWTLSDSINLSAFKSSNVHIAWVYTSTTAAASRWALDDIMVYNSTVAPAPSLTVNGKLLDFHQVLFGVSSAGKTFSFFANNLAANLTISAPAGFEVSKDGSTYSTSVTYTPAEASAGLLTTYVRFTPTMSNTVYSGYLTFSSTDFSKNAVFVKGNSQIQTTTLNVVNWNIEWFGSTGNGPTDENLQMANAKKVMDYLDADIYATAEIVNTTSYANLIGSLASPYSYVIGEYCSGATTAAACASSQKLALAYKTGVMTNVTARPLLISSTEARKNWASGRVPFLVSGNVTKNGQTTTIHFIVVHAKANTGTTQDQIDSYNERKLGVQELKDTLDTYFPNANIVLLGDFNDDLDRTIAPTTGNDTVSSYQPMVADSIDANHYRSVTLPLSNFQLSSTTGNPEVIDHVIISNEMASRYLMLSASLYNDIDALAGITNYAGTTSDHYPVLSRYLFGGTLPVKMVSFTAVKENNNVNLQWTTSQEVNTQAFIVERSFNGVNFERVGTVNARGNGTTGSTYQFIDNKPASGNNYYRLKTVDFDNKTENSRILKINFGKAFTVSLTPNPAREFLSVNLANKTGLITMQIVDMNGRIIRNAVLTNEVNKISLAGVQKGLYLVKIIGDNETYTEKLVVE